MKIPKQIQKVVDDQEIYTISTSSSEGMPNTVYVKFLKIYNDTQVLVADNKFLKTEKNLKENPRLAFVVLEKETKKAYQLKGCVEIHKEGQIFEDAKKWVENETNSRLSPKSAVVLNVEEIYSGPDKIQEE
jgi:uncharacterized protein